MTDDRIAQFRMLEGRQVSVALTDGSRMDDCQLVSAGRHGPGTVWLFANGVDCFVSHAAVADLWEAPVVSRAA